MAGLTDRLRRKGGRRRQPYDPATLSSLAHSADALALCTWCPSLCQHTCPVAEAEARRSTTPWALVSLAEHVRSGRIEITEDVAELLHHCVGCRACSQFCKHDNDVTGLLVRARAQLVDQGVVPLERRRFEGGAADGPHAQAMARLQAANAYEPHPIVSLIPGNGPLASQAAADAVEAVMALCERLDVDDVSCGDAAGLDDGYSLWFAGFHKAFEAQARRVHEALEGARQVVVMSPQTYFIFSEIYPQFGLSIDAELISLSDFLLPLLSGAVIARQPGRVAYHQIGCARGNQPIAARNDVPTEVLSRVLQSPVIALGDHGGGSGSRACGASGNLPITAPRTAAAMGRAVIDDAIRHGADCIVSFAPEAVAHLRGVAEGRIPVEHAIDLVSRAVVADGAVG